MNKDEITERIDVNTEVLRGEVVQVHRRAEALLDDLSDITRASGDKETWPIKIARAVGLLESAVETLSFAHARLSLFPDDHYDDE